MRGASGRGRKERGEGGLELGLRVRLALGGIEEPRAVDQAGLAGAEQIGTVVDEIEPFPPLGQARGARVCDQLDQIIACVRRGPGRAQNEAERQADSGRDKSMYEQVPDQPR